MNVIENTHQTDEQYFKIENKIQRTNTKTVVSKGYEAKKIFNVKQVKKKYVRTQTRNALDIDQDPAPLEDYHATLDREEEMFFQKNTKLPERYKSVDNSNMQSP